MNVMQKIIVPVSIKIMNFIPFPLIIFFAQILHLLFPYKGHRIVKKKSESKRNLIFLDMNSAIGDFIVSLRVIVKENELGNEYDLLVNEKFRGVLEKLNLENMNIIYKKSDFGNHKKMDISKDFNDIITEAQCLKKEYNNIYYFNTGYDINFLSFLLPLKYNAVYKMKQIYRRSNPFLFFRSGIRYCLYLYANFAKFKIKSVGNKSYKKLYMADFAYAIIHKDFPTESLMNMDLSKHFHSTMKRKTVGIMMESLVFNKSLKLDYLIKILNDEYSEYELILFGVGFEWSSTFYKCGYTGKLTSRINTTTNILSLIQGIASVERIIAYDTCISHIAAILKKPTLLIYNSDHNIVKTEFKTWIDYSSEKNFTLRSLNKKYFGHANDSLQSYLARIPNE